MRGNWSRLLFSGLLFGLTQPAFLAAQDSYGPPAPPESPMKVEPGTGDSLKQLASDVAALKIRMKTLEDQMTDAAPANKSQWERIHEKVKTLQGSVEKLQQDMVALRDPVRSSVVPTSAIESRRPTEEATALKPDLKPEMGMVQDQYSALAKKMDDIIKLNLQVQANTRDLTELKRSGQAMQADLSAVQSDITHMQQDIGRLRNQMDSLRSGDLGRDDLQRRYSGSLPLPTPPDSTATPGTLRPQMGTIRLVNSFLFPVNVVVDGKSYPLATNDAINLDHPPGTFTYEVVGIQGNTLRNLNAGETLTIRVVPR
jgi:predicted  nucleic acid-binding Zn-ribbon protein